MKYFEEKIAVFQDENDIVYFSRPPYSWTLIKLHWWVFCVHGSKIGTLRRGRSGREFEGGGGYKGCIILCLILHHFLGRQIPIFGGRKTLGSNSAFWEMFGSAPVLMSNSCLPVKSSRAWKSKSYCLMFHSV